LTGFTHQPKTRKVTQLGIGLIGVGQHGIRYARHITADVPEMRLVGLARRNLDAGRALAQELGCRAFADYRELAAHPDVDALIAVVPPTLHDDIVRAAAESGRALLLEKPAAPSLETGLRMLQSVRQAAIPVMVAQTLRYSEVVHAILEARPRIGAIHALRLSQRFEPSRPGWIDDPTQAGGGIILHTDVHSFDLVRLFSGMEGDRVSCERSAVKTTRTEDNFCALIRLDGGKALATVAGSRATASRSGPIELAGEGGQIVGDHVLGTVHIIEGRKVTPVSLRTPLPTVREVLRDFAGALLGGRPMPIPLEEGLRAVALAHACYESSRNGVAVAVPPIE
jgi:predicted dehydrogenase